MLQFDFEEKALFICELNIAFLLPVRCTVNGWAIVPSQIFFGIIIILI